MSGDVDFWPRLVLAILAAWRITHLLVREDGPGALLARLRATLGAGTWGAMFGCYYCMSLWVAAPLSLWVATRPVDAWIVWLALSGAACLCERIGQPEVVVQPLPETNPGEIDGMLRTAAEPAAGRPGGVASPGA